MDGPAILEALRIIVALLGVAALVAIAVRPLRLPFTVALVVVGMAVGFATTTVSPVHEPTIAPEIVLAVLLPGLVFEAAYRLDLTHLRRAFWGVALMAVPGVLISAGVVALFLHVVAGVRLDLAFIVGAMVSATDPVAVISTLRRLGVPPALASIVEGESLLNDATGLAAFSIAVTALTVAVGPADAAGSFVGTVILSVALGLAAGFVAARLMGLVDDHLIELTISVVLAYGAYLAADGLHLSGVIATVVAAVVLGNYGRSWTLSEQGVDALDTVWEFLAYVATAIAFLLVGLAIPPGSLVDSAGWIACGIAGALVGRAVAVYLLFGAGARLLPIAGDRGSVPIGWLHVMFWSGLRGAVAVAMALALPEGVPEREKLQAVTFGIVLFTLLVQGTTAGVVVRRSVAVEDPAA